QAIELLRLKTALAQGGEAEARLLALRYQLNPHMLMNSLSAISWLSSEAPQKIPRCIDNLSAILKSRLRPSSGQTWTVATEIQLAENLLELAAVRFGDQVGRSAEASVEASRCLLPEMLAQPLVENAIKYCPPDLASASIRVVAEIQQNHLVIKVQNSIKPGTTGTVADGLKIGHANIRQRLEICYGERAKFRFQTTDTLAVATLELPIFTSDKCS
ncbi:MAG: sensor histidine kinase, partial [Planctomycetaceae bacterium]